MCCSAISLKRQQEKHTLKNVQDRIIDKLELKRTAVGGHIDLTKNQASSYGFNDSTWETGNETDMSIPAGAGGIISTPSDLCQFVYGLFSHKLIRKAA